MSEVLSCMNPVDGAFFSKWGVAPCNRKLGGGAPWGLAEFAFDGKSQTPLGLCNLLPTWGLTCLWVADVASCSSSKPAPAPCADVLALQADAAAPPEDVPASFPPPRPAPHPRTPTHVSAFHRVPLR